MADEADLTRRESEVLDLLRLGLTNEEIAGRLGITLDGAKYHVSQIIGELGVGDRYEAASWEERRSGGTAGLAPLAALWRRATGVLPVKLSWIAAVASAAVLAVLFGGALAVAFIAWSEAEPEGIIEGRAVLEELGPGTTFHSVAVKYKRQRLPQDGLPDWVREEITLTFDETGALAGYTLETRGLDGTLYRTTELEDGDIVSRTADGSEREKSLGAQLADVPGITAEGYRSALMGAFAETENAVAAGDPREDVLGTRRVLVVSDSREISRPWTSTADLSPVRDIRRHYIWPDEFFEVRYEVVMVSEDGTETVVESTEYEVFEVLGAN